MLMVLALLGDAPVSDGAFPAVSVTFPSSFLFIRVLVCMGFGANRLDSAAAADDRIAICQLLASPSIRVRAIGRFLWNPSA